MDASSSAPLRAAPNAGPAFILKKAVLSALVALVLFSLMIGVRTEAGPEGHLIYWTRFGDLAAIVAIVFGGSIVIELLRQWIGPVGAGALIPARLRALMDFAGRWLASALLVFAFLIPVIFYDQRYILDLAILVLTYVMLGWGLNVVVGLAGLLDLGYVAFYAVGAYSYALLAQSGIPYPTLVAEFPFIAVDFLQLGNWAFWVLLPVAGILAAMWGVLLGFPVLRLRGDYLAIVTLAFGEIIRVVLVNFSALTNGDAGIASIPRVTFFGLPFTAGPKGFAAFFDIPFSPIHRVVFLYYLILALALLTNLVTLRLRRLPIGRAWEALREDEIACRSLGLDTTKIKLTAFSLGAMFGGFAGAFFAVRQGFVSPSSFNFVESATILAIVVLGGRGSQIGVAAAAIAIVGGSELLRELDFLKQVFGPNFDPTQYRMLLVGLAMVVMMNWRPRGFVSSRAPTIFLGERRTISADLVQEGRG